MVNEIYLLLGSNLGNRYENLQSAKSLIAEIGSLLDESLVYNSEPWGNTDQPNFLNQVIKISTSLSASELLLALQQIEDKIGRIRKEKWGARIIDIDILFYGNEILSLNKLILPHPGIPHRRFVLVPLAEIAATLKHPQLESTIQTLLDECDDNLQVMPYSL